MTRLTDAEKVIVRAVVRFIAFVLGVVLILAAVAEFSVAPLELLLQRDIQHSHRPALLTGLFLLGGILLAFPSVAQRIYEWAKPYIPKVSLGKSSDS